MSIDHIVCSLCESKSTEIETCVECDKLLCFSCGSVFSFCKSHVPLGFKIIPDYTINDIHQIIYDSYDCFNELVTTKTITNSNLIILNLRKYNNLFTNNTNHNISLYFHKIKDEQYLEMNFSCDLADA